MASNGSSPGAADTRVEWRDGKRVLISESPGVTLELTEDPDWTEGDTKQLLRLLFAPRPAQPPTQR